MKQCRKCNTLKPYRDFSMTFIKSVGKKYYRSYCRLCSGRIKNTRVKLNPRLLAKKREQLRKHYYKNADILNIKRELRRQHG